MTKHISCIKTIDPNTKRELEIVVGSHGEAYQNVSVITLFPNLPENSDTDTPVLIPTLAIIDALKERFTHCEYIGLWDLADDLSIKVNESRSKEVGQ